MQIVINVPEKLTCEGFERPFTEEEKNILIKAIGNGTPLDNLLQRLRKRILDLYNTDVTYDNGDYNTMDTPTLDKVLEYFDSEVNI